MKHPVYNQNRLAQIMHTVQGRLAGNCIPCLGQTCAKLYTLFRTERTKTIPRPGSIREYMYKYMYMYKGVYVYMSICIREYPPPPQGQQTVVEFMAQHKLFLFSYILWLIFFSLLSGKLLFSLVWEEWVLYEIIKTKVTLTTCGILASTFWCAGYLAQLANQNPNPFTVFSMTKRQCQLLLANVNYVIPSQSFCIPESAV